MGFNDQAQEPLIYIEGQTEHTDLLVCLGAGDDSGGECVLYTYCS